MFRRLSEAQYTQSVDDIFGPGIKIPGRFEPNLRQDGLLAIGSAQITVTASGFEQYDLRAREIARQVMDETHRKATVPCQPASAKAYDESCGAQFITKYGRLLFRRPLTSDEVKSVSGVARASTEKLGDFYQGLEFALARLLVSPNFIFLQETDEADPDRVDARRLDSYSLASRLSFLLWNSTPDDELLKAADDGTLQQDRGLARQVDRMLQSPRLENGVRSFFSDMLALDQFGALTKDQAIYPKFSTQLSKDAKEQTLKTIVDLLLSKKGDYRDLFTTKDTFLTRTLGAVYKVPVGSEAFGGWTPYTFKESDRRAGILTQVGFLMLDLSHPGRSSPTIRGKAIRELVLCQRVPAPPGNVNFTIVQDTANPNFKTARERLTAHRTAPTCAGCHAIMDPVGLAMETYDGIGEFRTQENGAPIDTSGTLDGTAYTDLVGLGKVLHDSPNTSSCLVQRLYAYGTGHTPEKGEAEWLKYLGQRFAADKYAVPSLLREIATSKAFKAISIEPSATTTATTASFPLKDERS